MKTRLVGGGDYVRPIILVFVRHYLPGDKSGGPVRSIANMVAKLSDEFDFRIVTSDRDWTDSEAYNGIVVDAWNQVGNAQVFYLSPKKCTFPFIVKLLSVTHHDVLYLNSYFDLDFTQKPLWARRLSLVEKKPLVIAPRGEFSAGAFALKYWMKVSYAWVAAKAGLFAHAVWHASTKHEAVDIRYHLTTNSHRQALGAIMVASDIPSDIPSDIASGNKRSDVLRIVFISRISPKKNLDFALRVLAQVQAPVIFNIYGPNDGDEYWRRCNYLIEQLPINVKTVYMGVLAHSEVMRVFREHDLFLFPTRGENFGHVIIESLSAGTPVLLANTTPWQNLEQFGVGWDLPLDNELEFVKRIEILARTSFEDREAQRRLVYSYAKIKSHEPDVLENNRNLFRYAVELGKLKQSKLLDWEAGRSGKSCAES